MLPEMKTTEPYSPIARAERQREAGEYRGQHGREDHPPPGLPARGAQTLRGVLDLGVDVVEHGLHRADDEGEPDERQRDHHAQRRERRLDPERLEPAARPARLRVDRGEGEAGDGRRQRERQIDERVHDALAGERVPHEHPRDEQAEHHVDGGGDQRGPHAEAVRRQRARAGDGGPELGAARRGRLEPGRGEGNQHDECQVEQRDAHRQLEAGQNTVSLAHDGHGASARAGRCRRRPRRRRSASPGSSASHRRPHRW